MVFTGLEKAQDIVPSDVYVSLEEIIVSRIYVSVIQYMYLRVRASVEILIENAQFF